MIRAIRSPAPPRARAIASLARPLRRLGGHALGAFTALALFAGAMPAHASEAPPPPGAKANRLVHEASPYLRQHAYNPVDWYPWGEEALEKARRENKPIMVSVGYSACHWCHVMRRESYSNPEIAKILNKHFVAIKVDRERRPDLDETYMLATELITGGGGWPNHVFLTPRLEPFMAGTYFPPKVFKKILTVIAEEWAKDPKPFFEDGARVAKAMKAILSRRVGARALDGTALREAKAVILRDLDVFYGGFGTAPKFPQEPVLHFLLRLAERDGDAKALEAVRDTLDAMLNGGIQDHVGGGFHRYAVDNAWRIPHFEKMLYNQALIGTALVRAYALTGAQRFARAARRTFDFVLREMTAPEGGFYAAFDADSLDAKGVSHEGYFYTWTREEVEKALGAEDAAFAIKAFGITEEGNFEGRNVLHFPDQPAKLAASLSMSLKDFEARVAKVRKALDKARRARKLPHLDKKVVAAWNGAMISALAEASEALGEPRYRRAALKAARFLLERMGGAEGVLFRSHFEGKASTTATQQDYAFTALAMIDLFDITGERAWLARAEGLVKTMLARFYDQEGGDFFMSEGHVGFTRAKSTSDSELPSGNAVALEVFSRLARRTDNPDHKLKAEALLAALSGLAMETPRANAAALLAGDRFLRGETGARQFLAKGLVRAEAIRDVAKGVLRVRLTMAKGWHVNAHKPLEDFFIPTDLEIIGGAKGDAVTYPKPVIRKLGFNDKPLALYEGVVEITAPLPKGGNGRLRARLRLQACSDEICLEPEETVLTLPPLPGT